MQTHRGYSEVVCLYCWLSSPPYAFCLRFKVLKVNPLFLRSRSDAKTAQNCDSTQLTISSSADAEAISSCGTFAGDVVIDSTASGSIDINGLKKIQGTLTAGNATQLSSISADSLVSIGGLVLDRLTILTTLSFPALTTVGEIKFQSLPSLQSLSLIGPVTEVAGDVVISNTQVTDLNGLNLTKAANIDINNNPYMTSIDLSNVTTTKSLSISANGLDADLGCDSLESAANITIFNVTSSNFYRLTEVSGALHFASSSGLSFYALESTGGPMTIADCSVVDALNLNNLNIVGGALTFANISDLTFITLPALGRVLGDLSFKGAFDRVSMVSIYDVQGNVSIQTTASSDLCDRFQGWANDGTIHGNLNCKTPNSNVTILGDTPVESGTASSANGSSSNNSVDGSAKNTSGMIAGLVVGILAAITLAAVAFWYCYIRPRRKRKARPLDKPHPKEPELPLGGHHEKAELPSDPNHVSELAGDRQQRDQSKEVVSIQRKPVYSYSGVDRSRGGGATISNPAELAWDQYEPRHELQGSDVPELRSQGTL